VQDLSPIGWALRPFRRYADFTGRSPRAEYWWYTTAVLVFLGCAVLIEHLIAIPVVFGLYGPVSLAFLFGTLLASLAVQVRRLHDLNWSGWWLLILYVPEILTEVARRVGASVGLVGLFSLMLAFASIAGLVLFARRGTDGPNRYGPDPYGGDALEEVFA
jgi:uncharacterized membrane protein YhaH (DUF805 family)